MGEKKKAKQNKTNQNKNNTVNNMRQFMILVLNFNPYHKNWTFYNNLYTINLKS